MELKTMSKFLAELPQRLGAPPKAILVISAHWEEDVVSVRVNVPSHRS